METRMEKEKAKVLIVDDHPIVRHALMQVIDEQPDLEVCGEAENAPQAVEVIEKQRVDLVLVDISLDGTDGIQLTTKIKSEKPHLPVLILTIHEEGLYAKRALCAGAEGYVTKHEDVETILSAIRLSLIGKQYVSEKMKEKLKKIDPDEG